MALELNSTMDKTKHLEMIQAVINRMANNSFLIKGWCVTLVAAILALASKDTNKRFIIVAYYPILMFWILDGYFLYQERLFRKLYDIVRTSNDDVKFSMDTTTFKKEDTWPAAFFSKTLLLFYFVMIVAVLLSMMIVLNVL
jgi:hypothetical protein